MQVIMEVSQQTRVLGLECDCRQLEPMIWWWLVLTQQLSLTGWSMPEIKN